jgi:hypothetical protein
MGIESSQGIQFEISRGIDLDVKLLEQVNSIVTSLHESQKANRSASLTTAFTSSLAAANSLLQAANTVCNLDNPSEEIEMVLDSSGTLIYRCYHSPSHKWKLDGNPI